MRFAWIAALCTLAACSRAHEPDPRALCAAGGQAAVQVFVTDSQSGAPVEAEVTVRDGPFFEKLGKSENGYYTGAHGRPGVYHIEVLAEGYSAAAVSNALVNANACGGVGQAFIASIPLFGSDG